MGVAEMSFCSEVRSGVRYETCFVFVSCVEEEVGCTDILNCMI